MFDNADLNWLYKDFPGRRDEDRDEPIVLPKRFAGCLDTLIVDPLFRSITAFLSNLFPVNDKVRHTCLGKGEGLNLNNWNQS